MPRDGRHEGPVADRVSALNARYKHHSATAVLEHALKDVDLGQVVPAGTALKQVGKQGSGASHPAARRVWGSADGAHPGRVQRPCESRTCETMERVMGIEPT